MAHFVLYLMDQFNIKLNLTVKPTPDQQAVEGQANAYGIKTDALANNLWFPFPTSKPSDDPHCQILTI